MKDSFKNKNGHWNRNRNIFASLATAIKYSDSKFKCAKIFSFSSSVLINSYDLRSSLSVLIPLYSIYNIYISFTSFARYPRGGWEINDEKSVSSWIWVLSSSPEKVKFEIQNCTICWLLRKVFRSNSENS